MAKIAADWFTYVQSVVAVFGLFRSLLRWLPRVFTNTLAIERELEKGT